ncbi:MAG: hypothetical protein IJR35_04690 [Synergistaceae bacterium]|nr:hypothetical protein [Synergistaceae bacterium]
MTPDEIATRIKEKIDEKAALTFVTNASSSKSLDITGTSDGAKFGFKTDEYNKAYFSSEIYLVANVRILADPSGSTSAVSDSGYPMEVQGTIREEQHNFLDD